MEKQWIPVAYTLAVEHRTCKNCGRVHIAPAPSVTVTVQCGSAKRTGPLGIYGIYDDIPRMTVPIYTNSTHCHECFTDYIPEQQSLVQEPGPRRAYFTTEELEKQVKSDLPLDSDFDMFEGDD